MTWIDLLREKLPDSVYTRNCNSHPAECPHGLLGGIAPALGDDFCKRTLCSDCWNSEVPEDERRK